VLDTAFETLQREQIVRIRIEVVSLDSTIVKVHPDGTGALRKRPLGHWKSRSGWTTKIHMVAANARTAITFALSQVQASGAKAGRELLFGIGLLPVHLHLIMDRAYEDNEPHQLAVEFGFIPVVSPKRNRLAPWRYDKVIYRRRNEVEWSFRRLEGFGLSFSRFTNSMLFCSHF
jgi:hypothetical protein